MNTEMTSVPLDITKRIRRSRGRSGRTIAATAKVTRAEHEELEGFATTNGKALGEWAREVLLREARSTGADPLFSEVMALRMMLANLLRPVCCGEIITAEVFDAYLQNIRETKQQVALDVRRQYAASSGKEQ